MMYYDKEFLKQLDKMHERVTHVRITALSLNDMPRETIEGRVTGGSINIDGKSAVRRSCSLSLIALEYDTLEMVTDIYWCYDNKFKLEIGLTNNIDPQYPNIIWFNMGIYVITSFNKSRSTNGLNISISGKDKMCRLNGEINGALPMTNDFGTIEYVISKDKIEIEKIPIRTIITEAVQEYAQELPHNIIINDLPDYGYELWAYQGKNPMYLIVRQVGTVKLQDSDGNSLSSNDGYELLLQDEEALLGLGYNIEVINVAFNLNYLLTEEQQKDFQFYQFNTLDPNFNTTAGIIKYNDQICNIAKISYGETAGYHQTPLVYNTDLIINAGEPITSLLDKLVAMLGDFEYFYDLDGHFVFQKKKTYIQELFSPVNGEVITPVAQATMYEYVFDDLEQIISISNSPNINNVKNEFSIWGTRKTPEGGDSTLPIHARYAIQRKPEYYNSPYGSEVQGKKYKYSEIPRLIYINWLDQQVYTLTTIEEFNAHIDKTLYYRQDNGFIKATTYQTNVTKYYELKTAQSGSGESYYLYQEDGNGNYFPYSIQKKDNYYFGKSEDGQYTALTVVYGKEKYMIDAELPYYIGTEATYTIDDYDWREIIYQMALDFYQHHKEEDYLIKMEAANPEFLQGRTGYEQYYSDLQGFWRQIYNPAPNAEDVSQYGEFYSDGEFKYWNKYVYTDPTKLNFWFDFLDTGGEIAKYSVDRIGRRSKTVNETSVKSIYYKETPEVLFIVSGEQINDEMFQNAYTKIQIQKSAESLFLRSTYANSAVGKANELINTHVGIAEGINITAIPIFYLQPNVRIYVSGVGDCTVESMSFNLSYNGTMSLTCNKILQSLG